MQQYRNIFLTALLLGAFHSNLQAQLERVMHQTFEIEEVSQINLDIVGDLSIEFWAGNNIMTETKVELFEASPAILNHFVEKEKRYAVEIKASADQIKLFSTDKERKAIRTRLAECPEIVKVRVFVPDSFEKVGDNSLIRK